MALLKFVSLPFILFLIYLSVEIEGKARLSTAVENLIKENKPVTVLVTMREDPGSVLKRLQSQSSLNRAILPSSLVIPTLQDLSRASLHSIESLVKYSRNAGSVTIQPLWISNQVILRNVPTRLIRAIQSLDEVEEIIEERIFTLGSVVRSKSNSDPSSQCTTEQPAWGIQKIGADQAWAGGVTGEGVKVGIIDTGTRVTHDSLQANYVGSENYGWFDPINFSLQPEDDVGHGTHVTGTIVGKNPIGVAPGAKWMACKGCGLDGCSNIAIATCLQFMACPTNATGGSPHCGMAPKIVSNSWAEKVQTDAYYRHTETLRSIGITVIFSAGNDGVCNSIYSPPDYDNVITVGSTNSNDFVSEFSSAGPTSRSLLKPDIVAPGESICSASANSDAEYYYDSGTSMACPHVAGVVALILSKNPSLTPDNIRNILIKSTDPVISFGQACGNISGSTFPNNRAGYGRINTTKALSFI